jgi:hypothetical protein
MLHHVSYLVFRKGGIKFEKINEGRKTSKYKSTGVRFV